MPSRNSVRDTAIQFVSLVLGSETVVAVAALGLEVLAAVVLATVVVVTVLVDRVPNVGVRGRFPGRRKQEAVIA